MRTCHGNRTGVSSTQLVAMGYKQLGTDKSKMLVSPRLCTTGWHLGCVPHTSFPGMREMGEEKALELQRLRAAVTAVLQSRGEEPRKMQPVWDIQALVQVTTVCGIRLALISSFSQDTSGTSYSCSQSGQAYAASSILPSCSRTALVSDAGQQYESEQNRAGRAGAALQLLGFLLPSFHSVGSPSYDHNK